MKKRKISITTGFVLAFLLTVIACAQAPATQPPDLPTPQLIKPTNTHLPPTSAPTIPTPTTEPETWDLLIISDSTNWNVGQYYAKFIEDDLNIKVNLHNCWVSGLGVDTILENLQNNTFSFTNYEERKDCHRPWPELVREAEVMLLFGNPAGSRPADGAWDVPESYDPACFFGLFENTAAMADMAVFKERMLQSCDPATYLTYQNTLNAILDEIVKIREGKPLILRMTDYYIPVHAPYRAAGLDDTCTFCMGNFSTAIQQVAKDRGVPQFSTMDVLNGPDHMLDPRESGYIDEDGGHLSEIGCEFVAEKLSQLGYAEWKP